MIPPAYTLQQCIERMPLHARSRFEDLRATAADAQALQTVLMERLEATQKQYRHLQARYGRALKTSDPEATKMQAELAAIAAKGEKLDRERSRRNSVATNAKQVLVRLEGFISAFWMGGPSNIVPPPPVSVTPQLLEGESVTDAVARLRTEIGQTRGELAMVRHAPLPRIEVELAILAQVDEMAEQGRPRLSVAGTKVRLDWPDQQEFTVPGQGALSAPAGSASKLLCWAFRDQIIKRLIAGITDPQGAVPASERPERVRTLEERLFGLEVEEEHFVSEAIAGGLEVHRRGDASPWAILGYGLAPEPAEAPIAEAAE